MTIKVSCSCGRTYRVPRDLMGSRLTCVECKQAIVIPRPGGTKPTQFPPTQPPGSTKTNQPSGGPKASSPGSASRRRLAYGLGASGVAVGLVILLVMALSGDKQSPEPPEPPRPPEGPFPIESIEDGPQLTQSIGKVVEGWKGTTKDGSKFEQPWLPSIWHKKDSISSLSEEEQSRLRLVRNSEGKLVHYEKMSDNVTWVAERMTGGGSGSCFVVSPDGYAITNRHVVKDHQRLGRNATKMKQQRIQNEFQEINAVFWVFLGERYCECEVVHVSTRFDMAILKLVLETNHFFRLHGSEAISRGMDVVVLGFPGAADSVLTQSEEARRLSQLPDPFQASSISEFYPSGKLVFSRTEGKVSRIVSSSHLGQVVQHNADTHFGHSGGPTVATNGVVIGINTSGVADAGIHNSAMLKQMRQEIEAHTDGTIWIDEIN